MSSTKKETAHQLARRKAPATKAPADQLAWRRAPADQLARRRAPATKAPTDQLAQRRAPATTATVEQLARRRAPATKATGDLLGRLGGSDDESDGFSLEEGRGNFIVRFHRRSAVREQSSEEEAEDFLCFLICDLLAVLPRASNQCWDEGICRRVSAGLNSCDGHEKSSQKNLSDRGSDIVDVSEINDTEHSVTIDVRGQYIDDAKEELMTHLDRCSSISDLRYLKAIVGCKVHGVGKGKLMQALSTYLFHIDLAIVSKRNNVICRSEFGRQRTNPFFIN